MIPAQDQHSDRRQCYKHCLKLLERKDYSRKKLSDKLLQKGFSSESVEDVLDEMTEKKFLREDFYIEARVKGLMRKSYHPFAIQSRLSEEGCNIESQDIFEIFQEYQIDPKEEGQRLVRKKLLLLNMDSRLPSDHEQLFKLKTKLIRFLSSKGYPIELAKSCIEAELTA